MKILGRMSQDGIQNRVQDILDTLKKYCADLNVDDYGSILSNLSSIVKLTHSREEYLDWLMEQVEKSVSE